MSLIRGSAVLILICLRSAAQSPASSSANDLARNVESQVRAYYNISPEIPIAVGPVMPSSDWPNFDTLNVTVQSGDGKKTDYNFLLSKDRATMLRMVKFDLTKDPFAQIMSKIDVTGRPVRGTKDAKVVVVNFDDFECPFCSRIHQTLFPEILKEYGDRVTFIYKDYPLTDIHPWAAHAAIDANCLGAQSGDAYWDFADYVHVNQRQIDSRATLVDRFSTLNNAALFQAEKHNLDALKLQVCIAAQDEGALKASMKEGDDLGVAATPTLFVNGQKMDGAVPIEQIRLALDQALKYSGQPVPDHSRNAESRPPSK